MCERVEHPNPVLQEHRIVGMQGSQVTSALAALLPQIINGLTPKGEVPHQNDIGGMLTGLLGSLGK